MTAAPLLTISSLTKRFPGVLALDSVDLDVRPGEVHALMGQNGAGKSTLIKILTGVHTRDAGTISFLSRPFHAASPSDAQRQGIATVFQETSLVPTLSVAENLFLARPHSQTPRAWYGLDWSAAGRRARELLARFDLRNVDVHETLGRFPVAIQQMVAIARAIDMHARLLVLDEPTSSLDAHETARLFQTIARLKEDGIGIIFVTHFLDQVYQVSDRITVLRNGRLVGTFAASSLTRLDLIGHMLGRSPQELEASVASPTPRTSPTRPRDPDDTGELLSARGLSRRDAIAPFDLTLRRAQTLGLAGLLGSGRTEAARLLFGADRPAGGSVKVSGRPIRTGSPRAAVRAGMGFCPEDRKVEGVIPSMSVAANIALVAQRTGARRVRRLGRFGFLSRRAQARLAEELVRRLGIKTPSVHQPVNLLSGGNQQKVLLARWLAAGSRVLILDEPTRGIDVGAKAEVERLIDELAASGAGVVFISAELDEVARRCSSVLVLRDRRVIAELSGEGVTEHAIMQFIAGDARDSTAGGTTHAS
jgi:monosaccharide-transporting ATPase